VPIEPQSFRYSRTQIAGAKASVFLTALSVCGQVGRSQRSQIVLTPNTICTVALYGNCDSPRFPRSPSHSFQISCTRQRQHAVHIWRCDWIWTGISVRDNLPEYFAKYK
jgi:hypothetical protein